MKNGGNEQRRTRAPASRGLRVGFAPMGACLSACLGGASGARARAAETSDEDNDARALLDADARRLAAAAAERRQLQFDSSAHGRAARKAAERERVRAAPGPLGSAGHAPMRWQLG